MIVWMDANLTPPFTSSVVGNLYEAFGDSVVTDLGGGCGNSGTNGFFGPVALGNAQLELKITGPPSSPANFVSIMFTDSTVPCGPCQIPSNIHSFFPETLSGRFALPIPCDSVFLGMELYTQWATVLSGASPCAILPASLELSLSNRGSAACVL